MADWSNKCRTFAQQTRVLVQCKIESKNWPMLTLSNYLMSVGSSSVFFFFRTQTLPSNHLLPFAGLNGYLSPPIIIACTPTEIWNVSGWSKGCLPKYMKSLVYIKWWILLPDLLFLEQTYRLLRVPSNLPEPHRWPVWSATHFFQCWDYFNHSMMAQRLNWLLMITWREPWTEFQVSPVWNMMGHLSKNCFPLTKALCFPLSPHQRMLWLWVLWWTTHMHMWPSFPLLKNNDHLATVQCSARKCTWAYWWECPLLTPVVIGRSSCALDLVLFV